MEDNLNRLKQKSIAVSSGKGGVGKTTTAVNLAIYYAQKNYRVGLIDLDPLSDIAVALDLRESEYVVDSPDFDNTKPSLADYTQHVFSNLDLLFPSVKLGKADSRLLREKLYIEFIESLINTYDLLIFDMPAGIRSEDNLAFLPYMGTLVIVTNAEPSSHVSAGGYLKVVLAQENDISIFFWHNRFVQNPGANFNPEDVIGNYNRNTPKNEHISPESAVNIEHCAFIPEDRSMDLLKTNPSVTLNIQRSLLDIVELIKEERLKHFAASCKIPEKTYHIIKYFLFHRQKNDSLSGFINELGDYIGNVIKYRIANDKLFARKNRKIPSGKKIFTAEQRATLESLFKATTSDALRNRTLKIIDLLETSIKRHENEKRLFFIGNTTHRNRQIDIEIGKLLLTLNNQSSQLSTPINNAAGLLLFYFSLYKLFHSKTLLGLLNNFIPVRKTAKGSLVRDKHTQIKNLIEESVSYRERYFKLIRILFPVISKQVTTIVETFGLNSLYYRTSDGKINKQAYVKLFSHFLHDTVNSGLGIIVGFRFRPASIAFRKGAEKLIRKLPSPPVSSLKKAAS